MKKNKLTGLFILICVTALVLQQIPETLDIDPDVVRALLAPDNIKPEVNETEAFVEDIPKDKDSASETDKTPEGDIKNEYDFDKTITINDPDTFFDCLTQARDSLITVIKIKFNNYDDDTYDIHKFERGKYTLASNGKSIGKTAYMTYTFNYTDNFAVTRACEDSTLIPRLNDTQKQTLNKLYAIKDLLITDNMSDYEKELALHDYIVKNYEYDTPASKNIEINDDAANITCFLTRHKGVCEAYSYTFKALCELCGIRSYVVTGVLDGVSHAWNLIELDGNLYHIDVTSDDPVPDMPQHCFYSHFNLTDEQIAKTHTFDNKWYNCTATKYNYFIYNNLVVNDFTELKVLAADRISRGYETVLFKKNGFTLTTDDVSSLLSNKGFTSFVITGDLNDPYADHEIRLEK